MIVLCHEYYIRLDYVVWHIPVSISQLTNNGGRADPNGRMGGDEVVDVRFVKIINVIAMAMFGTKGWPS